MSATASLYLASVHIYPVKSTRAVDLHQAQVEPWGLAGDRRWLVVDETGKFVTQRTDPALARVVAQYAPGDVLGVTAAGHPPLTVAAPAEERGAEMLWVTIWRAKVWAAWAGADADQWFSRYLGRPVRLVYLDDPTRRQVDPRFGAPDDRVNFADGYPLLLTAVSSLGALGRWLEEAGHSPVPMNRFRPNVVIAGSAPWAEDGWRRIRVGAVTFRIAKPCGRCVITTTDQQTGERGRQPLAMLGRRRRFGQDLVFGQNIIPDAPGIIRVGDRVEVIEQAA